MAPDDLVVRDDEVNCLPRDVSRVPKGKYRNCSVEVSIAGVVWRTKYMFITDDEKCRDVTGGTSGLGNKWFDPPEPGKPRAVTRSFMAGNP